MNITNVSHSIFTPEGLPTESTRNLSKSDTIDFNETLTRDVEFNESKANTVTFTENVVYYKAPLPPIIISILTNKLFAFVGTNNMILGNYPGGKDCKVLGNQCVADGLNTQAGFSAPFTMLNSQTAFLSNVNQTPFFNNCQVTLYNLSGDPSNYVTIVPAIVNNISIDGVNTYITFSAPVTTHTHGLMALNTDYQAHSSGDSTIASAINSYAGGKGSVADLPSKVAIGDNYFNQPGDGQYSFCAASAVTTNATPMLLLANNKYLRIRNNMSYMFVIIIGARKTDGSEHALFLRYGIIHNEAGTVSLSGSVATLGTDINAPGWTVSIIADNSNQALSVIVTGDVSSVVHWKVRLDTIEIG